MATGDRERTLGRLLEEAGYEPMPGGLARPQLELLSSHERELVEAAYDALGGKRPAPGFQPGPWDLRFRGFVVELDEQLHFNRYRGLTLGLLPARSLPWREPYIAYAVEGEDRCLKDGRAQKRWTSVPAEKMFGESEPPRRVRRLRTLGRLESCQEIRAGGTRLS